MKRAPSLLAPAVLLPIAAVVALSRTLPNSLATAVDAAPLLVFASGALLGLVTRRGRLVVGVVILALADCALVNVGGRTIVDAVALLLPINIAVVVWLGEANPLAGRGAILFGVTLLQAGIVAVLQHPQLAAIAESLREPIVGSGLGPWTALPQVAVFAFAAALGLILARFFLHGHSLAIGAAWALVASFLALDGARIGGPANVHFATAGLLLLVGAWEPRLPVARDDVTGLPARIEFARALRRLKSAYAVAYAEIDEFPGFRQEHGRVAARRMLRGVARPLARVGGGGRAYCIDGHRFAVLFPRTSARMAAEHLEVVRHAVQEMNVDVSLSRPSSGGQAAPARAVERTVSVTLSAGVAEAKPGSEPQQVLEAAEQALIRARQDGMNRVAS